MRVAIGLSGVEEEHVVGIGDERPILMAPAEHAPPNEDDAMCRVRLLDSEFLDAGVTPKVYDRDPEGFEEETSRGRRGMVGHGGGPLAVL